MHLWIESCCNDRGCTEQHYFRRHGAEEKPEATQYVGGGGGMFKNVENRVADIAFTPPQPLRTS